MEYISLIVNRDSYNNKNTFETNTNINLTHMVVYFLKILFNELC